MSSDRTRPRAFSLSSTRTAAASGPSRGARTCPGGQLSQTTQSVQSTTVIGLGVPCSRGGLARPPVSLVVYMRGRRGAWSIGGGPGRYRVTWDGKDQGSPCPGTYLSTITVAGERISQDGPDPITASACLVHRRESIEKLLILAFSPLRIGPAARKFCLPEKSHYPHSHDGKDGIVFKSLKVVLFLTGPTSQV
jgi:hypothetical protein